MHPGPGVTRPRATVSPDVPFPGVVRRLVEHRRPALVLALEAVQPQVPHPAPEPGRFLRGGADARGPADLDAAGAQLVAGRAALRLVLEQGDRHEARIPRVIEPIT